MSDVIKLLERQAAWQRSRQRLSWPEKLAWRRPFETPLRASGVKQKLIALVVAQASGHKKILATDLRPDGQTFLFHGIRSCYERWPQIS